MKEMEISANTVEEAVEEGLRQLGVKKENVQTEVMNEPSQGFLKFLGNKPAKVKLTVLREPQEYIKSFLETVLETMGLEGQIIMEKNGENIYVDIQGKDLGILIGKRGNTLNSLQYLCNVVLHRQFSSNEERIILDIENYRQKRKGTLEQLAHNLAQKAIRTKKEIVLEPMNPQERRIVHLALKDNNDIDTYSQGNEPYRKVVITPK